MHGGGNLGDLYAPHNQLRREVVRRYPENKVIILPQTIYYEGARNAFLDANVFRKHKNLIICARDSYSYRFLKAFAFSKNVLLVPDMAFCIDSEELKQLSCETTNKDLVFKRVDKESSSISILDGYLRGRKIDVSDWPFYEGGDSKAEKLYSLLNNGAFTEADRYAQEIYLPERFKVGVEHISKYSRIFSNRLHGAILAILLEKDVYMLDNSYGKNSQYYNTWLKDTTNVHLLTTNSSVNPKRKIKFFLYCILSRIMKLVR
jgi:pyruvyl transferase EpsO